MRRFIFIVLLCIVFEFSTLFCIRAEADVVDLGIFNGHQYFYDTGSFYSFDEARQASQAVQGRDLVSITSAAENDFLAAAIASMPNAANNLRAAWIGLFRVATTDPWLWVSSEPVSYSNWRPAGVGYFFAEPTGDTAGVMYINGENGIPLGLWADTYYAGYEPFNAIYEATPTTDCSIAIIQAHTLWFLCGAHDPMFSTITNITAKGGQGIQGEIYEWSIIAGPNIVRFEDDSISMTGSNIVTVKSIAASDDYEDVKIKLNYTKSSGERETCYHTLTVRGPRKLASLGEPVDIGLGYTCDEQGIRGYKSIIGYKVLTQFNEHIPDMPVNETFIDDWFYPYGGKWNSIKDVDKGPTHTTADGDFSDHICVPGKFWVMPWFQPKPVTPENDAANQIVRSITQEIRCGSLAENKGCLVQRHTLVQYRGKARHEGIVAINPFKK
jgi:hypothetical protein